MRWDLIGAAVLGFVGVVAGGLAYRAGIVSADFARDVGGPSDARRLPGPACPALAAATATEQAERLGAAATRARVAELLAAFEDIAGTPLEWRDFPSTAATADRVPELAARAARAAGAELVAIDCEEPPCVAMFEVELPVDSFNEDHDAAMRALQDGFGGEVALWLSTSELDTTAEPLRVRWSGPVWDGPEPRWYEDHKARVDFRRAALDEAAQDGGPERVGP